MLHQNCKFTTRLDGNKSLAAMQNDIPRISTDKIDQTQTISFHVQILSHLQLGSI